MTLINCKFGFEFPRRHCPGKGFPSPESFIRFTSSFHHPSRVQGFQFGALAFHSYFMEKEYKDRESKKIMAKKLHAISVHRVVVFHIFLLTPCLTRSDHVICDTPCVERHVGTRIAIKHP